MHIFKILSYLFLSGLFMFACSQEKKTTEMSNEQKTTHEQDLAEEVKSLKIDIVEMKQQIQQLADKEKEAFMSEIDRMESDLIDITADIDSLKMLHDAEWKGFKTKVDSALDYVELGIDSTRINIKQAIQ